MDRAAAASLFLVLLALPAHADQAEMLCARSSEIRQILAACTEVIGQKVLRDSARAAAYANRGWAHQRDSDHASAHADFDAALALDADNVTALLGRGLVDGNAGRMETALADFARVEKLQPDNTGVHVNRAQVFISQHRYAEALTDAEFERYGYGYGGTFLNLRCRARAYGGLDLEQARALCDQALWLSPNLPVLLEARGIVALKQKRYEAALADFARLTGSQPQAGRGWYGKALAESGLGQRPEAEADFAHARRINPALDAEFARLGLTPG